MSDSPPPSPLEMPDLRRRLQQQYELAQRLAGTASPDFRRIHELLANCLRSDPGSILYLDALLANLRRWGPRPKLSWWAWLTGQSAFFGQRTLPMEKPLAEKSGEPLLVDSAESAQLLQEAPNLLRDKYREAATLRQLAAACEACDLPEAELRYLQAARDAVPDDPETLRMLARSLTRQGRFEEAQGPWFAVLALSASQDGEAEQAVEDLRGSRECAENVEPLPEQSQADSPDAAAALRMARSLRESGSLVSASQYLRHAQAISGGDLAIWQEREELQLARSQKQGELARRRAASDPHPRAQQLAARLESEHNRLEIDILNLRCERLPGDLQLRVELARRLKKAGNFSGAIQRLDEARRDPALAGEVLLELGECWQHLRQYAKALDLYRQAVAAVEKDNPSPATALPQGDKGAAEEAQTLVAALYRIGVLATAMNEPAEAKAAFVRVIGLNPAYKDARERLDKLP